MSMPPRAARLPFAIAALLVVAAALLVAAIGVPGERLPARERLALFPLQLGEWTGQPDALPHDVIAALKLDDHVLADYRRDGGEPFVNFYVAYYASQRDGQVAHSPRACIPGGGWTIEDFSTRRLSPPFASGMALKVNRAVIRKGNLKQLVYYWFQQRGRHIANQTAVKLYVFWDGLTRGRTDGALVRVVTPIAARENEAEAERRLQAFVAEAYPALRGYVPG